MYQTLFLSLLSSLAIASAQNIDLNAVASAPPAAISGPPVNALTQTNVYDPEAAAAAAAAAVGTAAPISKREERYGKRTTSGVDVNAACAPQPDGYGPLANPNTVTGFLGFPAFASTAKAAAPPPGYTSSFVNLQGTTQQSSYLGLYTLQTYNASQCSSYCDQTTGCQAFNLYFERDPTVNPAANCTNPAAFTNVKCTLWGSEITAATATNTGQTRQQFQVVIAGSNGYNKAQKFSPPCGGFGNPISLPGAVNNPRYFLGGEFFNGPYDPRVCAAVCKAMTRNNRGAALSSYGAGGSPQYLPCNYFNAFSIKKNGCTLGLYCAFYSQPSDASHATLTSFQLGGQQFIFNSSVAYALGQQDPGRCDQ